MEQLSNFMDQEFRTLPIYDEHGELIQRHRAIDPTGAPPPGFRWGPEGTLMRVEEWQRLFGRV